MDLDHLGGGGFGCHRGARPPDAETASKPNGSLSDFPRVQLACFPPTRKAIFDSRVATFAFMNFQAGKPSWWWPSLENILVEKCIASHGRAVRLVRSHLTEMGQRLIKDKWV